MIVSRIRRPGSTPKLVSTWTGSRQIVTADKVHVYGVQILVTGEVKDVYMVRLRFNSDKKNGDDDGFKISVSTYPLITSEVKNVYSGGCG